MPIQGFHYGDLGGGLNESGSPSQIQSRQFSALRNFYPYGTKIRRRGGVRKLTTSGAWDVNITGMFPLKKADGTWALIVCGPAKFGKLVGTSIADLTLGTGLTLASTTLPASFFMYKDFLYCLRAGNSGVVRITETDAQTAGILAPSTVLALTDSGAGALTAGDFRAVVTYYNRATAMESNPSEVSNTLTLAGSRSIDYGSIPISTNTFVDARRLYRTLADQVGVYFFVTQINDNSSTTYLNEETSVTGLGRTVSFENGQPPTSLKIGVMFGERLMASDGVDVFFSELLLPECFGEESIIPVYPDDGHVIRALHAFGDRLIVGKTNKMHYIVGNDRSTFGLQTLSDRHGCMSHHSLQSAEGSLFWYGNGKAIFRSDGTTVSEISTIRVKTTLEAIPDEQEENIIGTVFEDLNWYVLSVPQTGYSTNRKVLIYNYKSDAWTIFDHPSDAPQFIGDFFTENYGHILYSTFYDGHIYQYNDETYGTDFENAITASFTTKRDNFGAPGYRKWFDEVWAVVPRVLGGTMRLEVLRDELSAAVRDRTVSLDIADGNSSWKAFKLGGSSNPGTQLALRGTYTGSTAIDIDELFFQVGLSNRKPKVN